MRTSARLEGRDIRGLRVRDYGATAGLEWVKLEGGARIESTDLRSLAQGLSVLALRIDQAALDLRDPRTPEWHEAVARATPRGVVTEEDIHQIMREHEEAPAGEPGPFDAGYTSADRDQAHRALLRQPYKTLRGPEERPYDPGNVAPAPDIAGRDIR